MVAILNLMVSKSAMSNRNFKIQRGVLKGHHFRYPPRSHGYNSFTPSIVREAFFEILLNRILSSEYAIEDYVFFDLCTGSGQIGLEAASIGFKKTYLTDIDFKRVDHIKTLVCPDKEAEAPFSKFKSVEVQRRDFRAMSSLIYSHKLSVLYFDLPYSFWKGEKPLGLEAFLLRLEKSEHWDENLVWVFIQGPRYFRPDKMKYVTNLEFRHYGRQHLSFWLLNRG